MRITCIADLHGYYPALLGGDLLILAGDFTASDKIIQWAKFFEWLKKQPYQKKVVIPGNHDGFFESGFPKSQKEAEALKEVQHFLVDQKEMTNPDFEYLCDSGTEFEGLKIWGSPWSLWFSGVNPLCKAFMDSETHLERKFKKIPDKTDILITHTPPYGILDKNEGGASCGSVSLLKHLDRVKPKLHVFGHIHEQGGGELLYKHIGANTWCANCSHVNERYKPVNKPYEFEL